ncbi:MAG: YciI family protein [Marmoricola sp.]
MVAATTRGTRSADDPLPDDRARTGRDRRARQLRLARGDGSGHAATSAFNEGLAEQGYWVFAGGLVSASQAAVVDGRADGPMVTDGPYLESKELLAGFWVIDVPDHATAVEIAAGASVACGCAVEIRAFDAYS